MKTAVRHRVLLLAFLAAGITYLDRVCIAAAALAGFLWPVVEERLTGR